MSGCNDPFWAPEARQQRPQPQEVLLQLFHHLEAHAPGAPVQHEAMTLFVRSSFCPPFSPGRSSHAAAAAFDAWRAASDISLRMLSLPRSAEAAKVRRSAAMTARTARAFTQHLATR